MGERLWRASATLWLLAGLLGSSFSLSAGTTHPYYRRSKPAPQPANHYPRHLYPIDLANTNVHLPPYPDDGFNLSAFADRYDARAAAAVKAALGPATPLRFGPSEDPKADLLELNNYKDSVPGVLIPTLKCLAAMAYPDYFPDEPESQFLRALVSEALSVSGPGWVGTFGPGVEAEDLILDALDGIPLLDFGEVPEGNYDMAQMHLVMLAYRYYDDLTPEAREHLINELLQKGRVHRPGHDDTHTSGNVPIDWPRAGTIKVPVLGNDIRQIGETENHILMILTARYLSNQLLYQRTQLPVHDNRRNASNGGPACTDLVLSLLRNFLRGDFSEYNSKNYQKETRWALLNLYNYAYDHEVRLAARMVLDYLSARYATTSSDLRRLLPFRRKNEFPKNRTMSGGFMDVGLVEYQLGADVMTRIFMLLTGNTRALKSGNLEWLPGTEFQMRPWQWALADFGHDFMIDVLSDYRLPPSIHDLFVNDSHRRFFQRVRRTPRPEEQGGNRNVDNMEITAGSPSYLITAGGAPADQAIPGFLIFGKIRSDRGVAVPTSFMPTGESAGPMTQNSARDLIQFGIFSDEPEHVANYGVAPDFACGYKIYLPPWIRGEGVGKFLFVKQGYSGENNLKRPSFYLAIYQESNGFALMEAYDTWLHPGLGFDQFKAGVLARNANLNLQNNVETQYTTQNGNRIHFVIWNDDERDEAEMGARVLRIEYGSGDPTDRIGDAGNVTDRFLNGTVLNSPAEAVVEISNPFLNTTITLDMSDKWRPKRIDENGVVEQAGNHNEVWVDFAWTGPTEGDVYRPFNTLAAAAAAVADGGVIKILPGITDETPTISGKQMTIEAPLGGVLIGTKPGTRWVLRDPNGPPPRFGHGMVYDQARRVTVLFGGQTNWGGPLPLNDLWEWDGANWSQRMANSVSNGWTFVPNAGWRVAHTNGPVRRGLFGMAYDSRRKRVVVFGGRAVDPGGSTHFLRDLWEWDGTQWHFRATNGPVPRFHCSLAYDERRGRTVLFGGQPVPGLGEAADGERVWEWDGEQWHTIQPPVNPSSANYRAQSRMTYDSVRGVIVFGPTMENHSHWAFWDWNGAQWSIFPVVHYTDPVVSAVHGTSLGALAFDANLQRSTWFGGLQLGTVNHTVFFDGKYWTRLTNSVLPASRVLPAMAYDSDRRVNVMFGGSLTYGSAVGATNDTWELITIKAPSINQTPRAQRN